MRWKEYYWDLRKELGALTADDLTLRSTVNQASALNGFFRDRVSIEQSRDEIRRAIDKRADSFLDLVETRIYACPQSPYLKLLQYAGCEHADLRTLVRRSGVEAALAQLAHEGVYFTAAEFKGKTEVVRGSLRFRVTRPDFARRDFYPGLMVESSGTSNRPQRGHVALDWIAVWTWSKGLFLAAHDLMSASHAVYDNVLPAPAATYSLLHNARLGIVTDRWFAQKMPYDTWIGDLRTRWATSLIVRVGRRAGPGFPAPEMLHAHEVRPVLDWMEKEKGRGNSCCIDVTASNGVRIARAASDLGMSLQGTTFILHGEPFSEAKRDIIAGTGARCTTRYSFSVGIQAGQGCADPASVDDVHFNSYMLAVVPHPTALNDEGPAIHPLLFTTLYPQAALLYLNVENGDYATVEERECGCLLGEAGLRLHLSRIRSHEKFTAEGWTYVYWDLYELMERVLPAEFGGGPGDYQLVEEEDAHGLTRLSLLIDPSVGALDDAKVSSRLHELLAGSRWGNRSVVKAWQRMGTFRVRREVPRASPRGKILPLHIRQ